MPIKNKKLNFLAKGSAIVYALVIMAIVAILLTSILQYVVSQMKFNINRVERERAFQIAEAGVYYYRWFLAHQTAGMTAAQLKTFWESEAPGGTKEYAEVEYVDPETQEGIGKYQITVKKPEPSSTVVTATVTGWTYKAPNTNRVVQVRFRRPSWSEYLFLSNSFINFGNQSEVFGKVFSNNGIHFDGLAHNTVNSHLLSFKCPVCGGNKTQFGVHTTRNEVDPEAPSYPWPDGTVPNRPDIFMGGRAFPIPDISFNGVATDLTHMKNQAQSGLGKYFDASGLGRKIIFKSGGTYDVCTVDTANKNLHTISKYKKMNCSTGEVATGTCDTCSGQCLCNYPIVNDGVIFVENSAWVEGSINNKRATVVAAGSQADIYIGISNNNLRYAAYNCDNILGLVAQRDVRVLGECPTNFIVDAALLAQTGVVGINDNGFSGKNSLTFNGAIASFLQPYFQHGNSGFAQRLYTFDNNLLYCPPPYFPTGTEYSIDLWDEL
jgi:type II secretory pathway pseudopilin PulG